MKRENVSAILLAGGQGSRFHAKKQFVEIDGKPMWQYPYEKLCDLLGRERVVVVGIDIPGGNTRSESVFNGMKAVPTDTERVVIVEAARPLVTSEQLAILIDDEHPSITFVRSLVNTVIFRDGRYLNRNELYDLLTPQGFDYRLLLEAMESGRFQDMTDETRVMFEYHGIAPKFIETAGNLMKVTYPEDILVLQALWNYKLEGPHESPSTDGRHGAV